VVNGRDKNFIRFLVCIAAYRARFGAWPTHARFDPVLLWDLAQLLDYTDFERLGMRMELRTQVDGTMVSVGGAPGVQRYEDVDDDRLKAGALDEAARWLGVEVRPELRGLPFQ
jgi:hypothetical protein